MIKKLICACLHANYYEKDSSPRGIYCSKCQTNFTVPQPAFNNIDKLIRQRKAKECPEYNYLDKNYQEVIDWAKENIQLRLEWVEELNTWSANDWWGGVSFYFNQDEEEYAKVAAAIFYYLWLKKGVDISIARKCATSYVKCFVRFVHSTLNLGDSHLS